MRSSDRNLIVRSALPKMYLERVVEIPNGDLAWPWAETLDLLHSIVVDVDGIAVLGGSVCAVENGVVVESVEAWGRRTSFPLWDTAPRDTLEGWSEYCRRTLDESLRAISNFEDTVGAEKERFQAELYLAPAFAMPADPRLFVPRDKHDNARAELAIEAGYPAVEPVLPELLECLSDMNWPVARTLEPFLSSIGLPLVPHLRLILSADDEIWKDGIMSRLISGSRELAVELRDELARIARSPTDSEIEQELDAEAKLILSEHGLMED